MCCVENAAVPIHSSCRVSRGHDHTSALSKVFADDNDPAWLNMLGALQVLNVLAPAQMQRGDTMGAQSMLQSSFTLSKGLHDLPTMLTALQGRSDFYAQTGDTTAFNANKEYVASKQAAYELIKQDAVQASEHSKIMQWQGFT